MENSRKTEIVGKAIITAIPWIGGSITSVWSDLSQGRKENRIFEFVEGLRSELENRISDIDNKKINSEDMQDLFENALEAIIRNRNEQKRIALRHVLVNTITKRNMNFDEAEMFSDLVIRMPVLHLSIFCEIKNIKIEKTSDGSCREVISKLLSQFEVDIDELMECIIDLENENLINQLSSSYETSHGNGGFSLIDADSYLTKKGLKFFEYISN